MIVNLLGLIGLVKVIIWLYSYIKSLCLLKALPLTEVYGKNSWVVVTGATDGIGLEYCKAFAREGFNIVMISRSQEKLGLKKQEVQSVNAAIKIKVIAKDFTSADKAEFYSDLANKLEGLDISILANNVGFSIDNGFFKLTPQEIKDIFTVTVQSMYGMTKLLVPKLLKRKTRSGVINVTSVVGMFPMSVYQVYNASKGLLVKFVEDQSIHLHNTNVDMLNVMPGLVATNMSGRKEGERLAIDFAQTTESHTAGVIQSMGNVSRTLGSFYHRAIYAPIWAFSEMLPLDLRYYLGKSASSA